MRGRGVWWDDKLVALSRDPSQVVHGLGVVSLTKIKRGTTLFRIPRKACFGAASRADEEQANAEQVDSQAKHALLLLNEATKGEESEWAPLIKSLPNLATYDDLPWLWPKEEADALFRGTELEKAIAHKRVRVAEEYTASRTEVSQTSFARTCGVVLSHLNPFFGTAVVPFVYVLNCPTDGRPNVDFQACGPDMVEGVAARSIRPGTELTQAYGGDELAQADLVFRCGFALDPNTVLDDVVSVSEDLLFSLNGVSGEVERKNGDSNPVRAAKSQALRESGLVQESPWDGLQDLWTVELRRGTDITEAEFRLIECLGQLAMACAIAVATPDEWARMATFGGQLDSSFWSGWPDLDAMDKRAVLLRSAIKQVLGSPSDVSERDLVAEAAECLSAARASPRTSGRGAAEEDESESDSEDEDEPLWEALVGDIASLGALRGVPAAVSRILEVRLSALPREVSVSNNGGTSSSSSTADRRAALAKGLHAVERSLLIDAQSLWQRLVVGQSCCASRAGSHHTHHDNCSN